MIKTYILLVLIFGTPSSATYITMNSEESCEYAREVIEKDIKKTKRTAQAYTLSCFPKEL